MKNRYFFVVGDRFREFADGKDVLTLKQLDALFDLPKHLLDTRNILLLGQGVRQEEVVSLLDRHRDDSDHAARFEIADLMRVEDRAGSSFSHKHVTHNTLIGTPRQIGRNEFEVPLNIDERCELMGDHQTGQHLQGMVLVEAFRQSFLAVTETYFPIESWKKTYFVINEMTSGFESFVFPLPAHIDYRIINRDVNERRARYKVEMAAVQNGVECATTRVTFTVYEAGVIAAKEAELANVVTQEMIAALQQPASQAKAAMR